VGPVTRESIEAKARRLLEAGNVEVVKIQPRRRLVLVTGDTGTHRVLWQATVGDWLCSCPTPPKVRCSHIAAAELALRGRLPESAVWWSDEHGWQARQAP
jgi:hypothetical protein